MMLTREDILAKDDLKRVKVTVPEWGDEVYVRTMTALELDQYEMSLLQDSKIKALDKASIRARLVAWTCCDENGKRLFSEDDIEALSQKNGAALQRLFLAARRINGLGRQDIEELEKNL